MLGYKVGIYLSLLRITKQFYRMVTLFFLFNHFLLLPILGIFGLFESCIFVCNSLFSVYVL
jgi:hypothetical protein